MSEERKRILLGVTADVSLKLMEGFPQFLGSRGWEVHVASSPGPNMAELARLGVHCHALPMERRPHPISDLRSIAHWLRLVLRLKPDVLSVGTPKAGLLGSIAGWAARVPLRVYMVRGLPLETKTGAAYRLLWAAELVAIACAHRAVAVSHSLRTRLIDLELIVPEKAVVVGEGSSNGVDLVPFEDGAPNAFETIPPASLGLEDAIPVVGFVGRIANDKGLDLLLAAREILDSRGIDHQMLIVGGADDAKALADLEKMRHVGRRTAEAGAVRVAGPYYQLMDLLCLPTRREGFPNVVLEAAAARVPTVTTDAVGAVDSVVDGSTGYVVPRESPKELADALERLIKDEPLRRTMGEAARTRVEAHFDRRKVWEKYEEFYDSELRLVRGSHG